MTATTIIETGIADLQKVGFTEYEARAYIALLQFAPATGYEISKRSGIPRASIYEVLNRLRDRGAIYIVPSEPIQYVPVPAKEYLDRLKESTNEVFQSLDQTLSSLAKPPAVEVIRHLQGEDNILAEIKSLITRAEKEVWLSIWEPQIPPLLPSVQECLQRDVSMFSIVFGNTPRQLGTTFFHNYMPPEVVINRQGGCLHIAIRDNQEVIISEFLENSPPWAVHSKDPALILVATEYIRHDIMINVILQAYGPDRLNELWVNSPELTHVITGKRQEKP